MKKDKKELEKKAAPAPATQSTTTVKVEQSNHRSTEPNFMFRRYAFDSAGGGYQGL